MNTCRLRFLSIFLTLAFMYFIQISWRNQAIATERSSEAKTPSPSSKVEEIRLPWQGEHWIVGEESHPIFISSQEFNNVDKHPSSLRSYLHKLDLSACQPASCDLKKAFAKASTSEVKGVVKQVDRQSDGSFALITKVAKTKYYLMPFTKEGNLVRSGPIEPKYKNKAIELQALAMQAKGSGGYLVAGRITDTKKLPKEETFVFAKNFVLVLQMYRRDGTLDRAFGEKGTLIIDRGHDLGGVSALAVRENGEIALSYYTTLHHNIPDRSNTDETFLVRYTAEGKALPNTVLEKNDFVLTKSGGLKLALKGFSFLEIENLLFNQQGDLFVIGKAVKGSQKELLKPVEDRNMLNIFYEEDLLIVWRFQKDGSLAQNFYANVKPAVHNLSGPGWISHLFEGEAVYVSKVILHGENIYLALNSTIADVDNNPNDTLIWMCRRQNTGEPCVGFQESTPHGTIEMHLSSMLSHVFSVSDVKIFSNDYVWMVGTTRNDDGSEEDRSIPMLVIYRRSPLQPYDFIITK